jgi:transposase InsO family protein
VDDDETPLTQRIIELASVYGRYGTPRITSLIRRTGWHVNHKRVERIWKRRRSSTIARVWAVSSAPAEACSVG